MNFYEINYPYYALIKAEDKGEAVQSYIANVSGDSIGGPEIEEELKEVDRDYVLIKLSRSTGENGKLLKINEVIQDFNINQNSVLLIDGRLL